MQITGRFKTYFWRGLAALLPTILTIWIFFWGYTFIQNNISIHIKNGLIKLMIMAGAGKEELGKFWIDSSLSLAGFLLALIAVCIIGIILASVVGKTLLKIIEKFIMNTPLLKQVYPYIKQITDFLLARNEQKKMFSSVVAVEYPRKGIWSVGMVTGNGLKKVVDNVEKEFLTILMPTSPTPFTGFVIMAPKEDTIALDMSIEVAFRFIISGGVIMPLGEEKTSAISADNSGGQKQT